MRKDYLHLTLIIDESGSMYSSKDDTIGGVKNIIEEQKKNKDGKVTVSMYTFNDTVKERFVGKDINDDIDFEYSPSYNTAMNDGIGTAIDKTGQWLANMEEDERPGKVLVAIFTDGMENASTEYTLKQVKEMIKHQEDVYSWSFIYMGTDITTSKAADELGFKFKTFSSRSKLSNNYDIINSVATSYRAYATQDCATVETLSAALDEELSAKALLNTEEYEKEIGQKISTV